MSPKSELMIYIGVADGMETNFKFMRLPNNVIFTSAHALFDETLFPKCAKQKQTKNTRIGGPRSKDTNHPSGQPPVPWDDDDEIPSTPVPAITPEKGKGKAPDVAPELPSTPKRERSRTPSPVPPEQPWQSPRRSGRLRKVPKREGNIYGERKHPVFQYKQIERERAWKDLVEGGSSPGKGKASRKVSRKQMVESELSPPPEDEPAPVPSLPPQTPSKKR
ncbi:hypothetical protein PUNSTDRAFT_139201 [Punctularia strigosozonata HHB-11173 SS5]|uniref:Uncharacterized protein n=1 Tax=Punctularia strigosozonata (strain HHB-11173) TaxID=741275 RepID=R7S3T7_PUNST|nr:uncharacterized protein PUNSTDRAFT_139201 [Punctularia strigosozonata HHB-11173 SS5]EIN03896.1 hypothetical protein PUNSTDRAFT_139201 [Punctularia strigosozonata HHB-11173 SS5]